MRTGSTFPRAMRFASALLAAAALVVVPTVAASALTEPSLPEPVASYLATGLVPRLEDLYGPGERKGSGIDFDGAVVGTARRVLSFTSEYLAGRRTATPTELSNTWVAPVTIGDQVAGLATVWINPADDEPELAAFTLGPELPAALAGAPAGTLLLRDDARHAWFATDGTTLTPLVRGESGVSKPVSFDEYRKRADAGASAPAAAPTNHGLVLAAAVLGVVLLALVVFVILPVRRRPADPVPDEEVYGDEPDPVVEPAEPPRAGTPDR